MGSAGHTLAQHPEGDTEEERMNGSQTIGVSDVSARDTRSHSEKRKGNMDHLAHRQLYYPAEKVQFHACIPRACLFHSHWGGDLQILEF